MIDDNTNAGCTQGDGTRAAEPARRTGHDGHLAGKPECVLQLFRAFGNPVHLSQPNECKSRFRVVLALEMHR